MRYVIILLLLSSCTSTYHLKKAIKNTYFKTHRDTIIKVKYKYIKNPKTRQEVRLESKKEIKIIKESSKTDRLEERLDKRTKQTEIRNKNGGWKLWIFLFVIGFLCGGFIALILKK